MRQGVGTVLWALIVGFALLCAAVWGAGYWLEDRFGSGAVVVALGVVLFVAGGLFVAAIQRSTLKSSLYYTSEVLGFAGEYARVDQKLAGGQAANMRSDGQIRVMQERQNLKLLDQLANERAKAITAQSSAASTWRTADAEWQAADAEGEPAYYE